MPTGATACECPPAPEAGARACPVAWRALALALWLAAARAMADVGEPRPFHVAAIPMATYGSDVGLSLGVAAFAYRPSALHGRWQRLSISAAYATRGPRSLQLQWEEPRLRSSRWGTLLDIRMADDNRAPYWGEGAELGGLAVAPGGGTPPEPYRFHGRVLFVSGTLRPATAPRPSPYFRVRWSGVDVVEQSALLAAARPPGAGGGTQLLGEAGILVDTRDRDVGTHRGVWANASAFAAPPLGAVSDGRFAGLDLAANLYAPVGPATVAVRLLYDTKLGDVPFYERTWYEGIAYGGGLGGAGTIRGVARSRLEGDEKGLATLEARVPVYTAHQLGRALQFGLASGIDAGYARQKGYRALGAVGAFGGLRLFWDEAVLLRFEMAYSPQGGSALYVVTGEQF